MRRILFFLKNNITFVLLFTIWVLALFLRVYKLGTFPHNFHEDEVLVGYVGRYIIENGKDIYGNPWPLLYFNKFDDYYIIGPMYLSGLSTLLFGVNEFAVRFPAAFIGSLIVFPMYGLTLLFTNNKKISLISAFFISILPWHIILSRSSVEGIIGATFFLSGMHCILTAMKKNSLMNISSGFLVFITSYFIYHPFRIYVPLFFIGSSFFILKIISIKVKTAFFIGLIFFTLLTGYIATTPWGSGRLSQTSIFGELSGVRIKIQEQIFATGQGRLFEARLFHNKLVSYSREYINQYLSYFSPTFLFMKGGAESRYDIPDHGLLYIIFLLFIIASLIPLKKALIQQNDAVYLWFIILLAPVPAALTYYGSPNIHRVLLLGIFLVIPAAIGVAKLSKIVKYKKTFIIFISLILFWEITYFYHQYTVQSEQYNAVRRNDGYQQIIDYIKNNHGKYEKVHVFGEGNTALYYAFYTQDFNPKYLSKFGRDARISSIGNIWFSERSCPTEENMNKADDRKTLFINYHSCAESNNKNKINEIRGKNPLLVYKIYE